MLLDAAADLEGARPARLDARLRLCTVCGALAERRDGGEVPIAPDDPRSNGDEPRAGLLLACVLHLRHPAVREASLALMMGEAGPAMSLDRSRVRLIDDAGEFTILGAACASLAGAVVSLEEVAQLLGPRALQALGVRFERIVTPTSAGKTH
ncbi:MAG: hypothetical protein R3B09_32380 [Nannocystaceae bacterium]